MEAGSARRSMRSRNGQGWVAAMVKWCVVVVGWSSSGMMVGSWAWNCAASDRQTLLDLKAGFVDRDGVFATWNVSSSSSSSNSNCCTWSRVTCRERDGAVVELALVGTSGNANQQTYRDASSSGATVGASLPSLTALHSLTIQWVLFDAPIPSQWGQFSGNLQAIVINDANLRDDIPSSLAFITNLQTLDLKSNHLTGAIPAAFCDQQSINYIDVSYNDMDYLLVPTCLQQGQQNYNNGRNVTVVYNNQGQSTSPGAPAASTAVTFFVPFIAFGALSFAVLLSNLLKF